MIPSSTYRVQLHKDFGFARLREIVPYLNKLGIDTIYASPVFEAVSGSTHGYDVTNPHRINPEIGTLDQFRELRKLLESYNMYWIQDIVPNHMALHPANVRLMDVLERGPQSEFYNYFDIDWHHPDRNLNGKLLLPVLGQPLQSCIDSGELQLTLTEYGVVLDYFETQFPLSLPAYFELNAQAVEDLQKFSKGTRDEWIACKNAHFANLPEPEKNRLITTLNSLNKDPVQLTLLLDKLFYHPAFWRTAETVINYRRFFTVNSLICLKMEDQKVFDEYHRFIFELYGEGLIDGLRVDHIDGLNNPQEYLGRLRNAVGSNAYVVVEKILEQDESIPAAWPIAGETGYQFLAQVNNLLTNKNGSEQLRQYYEQNIGKKYTDYPALVRESKIKILTRQMHGEWNNLTRMLLQLAEGADLLSDNLKEAIGSLLVSFPVYRTYPQHLPLTGADANYFAVAVQAACAHWPALEREIRFIDDFFNKANPDEAKTRLEGLRRLMQFSGPLMAKGVEDTAFYNYNALLSHNEVGNSPNELSTSVKAFHEKMVARQKQFPFSMNGTSSHDTKRGEDARMRLNALTYHPSEWTTFAQKWWNGFSPDSRVTKNDRYMLLQAMVAAYADEDLNSWQDRLNAFIEKALREGKENSTWENPDAEYEASCMEYAANLLHNGAFKNDLQTLLIQIRLTAQNLSLFQVVLKTTAPGIPDIYQGNELPNYSFVDPDNRRPVAYTSHKALLTRKDLPELDEATMEGYKKFHLTHMLLQFRKAHAGLFNSGSYLPLDCEPFGFVRKFENNWLLVLLNLDSKTEYEYLLPKDSPSEWKDVITGTTCNIEEIRQPQNLFSTAPYRIFFAE